MLHTLQAARYDVLRAQWTAPRLLAEGRLAPAIAVDAAGHVTVAWADYGAGGGVHALRFDPPREAWGEIVSVSQLERAWAPVVVADPGGDALVYWREGSTLTQAAYARYERAGRRWHPPRQLSGAGGLVAHAASDGAGNIIAVLELASSSRGHFVVNRFDAGRGLWGDAQWLASLMADWAGPRVVATSSGDAMVAWGIGRVYSPNPGAWSRRYSPRGGWRATQRVSSVADRLAFDLDARGNAVGVWAIGSEVWVSWCDAKTDSWGPGKRVGTTNDDVIDLPLVAVAPDGEAVAAWRRPMDITQPHRAELWAAHVGLSRSAGDDAQRISGSRPVRRGAVLLIDHQARVTAIWVQDELAGATVWARRYE